MTRSTHMNHTPATAPTATNPPWRRVAASLVALALLSVFTLSLASAAGGAKAGASATTAEPPKVYQPSGHGAALAHGVVDMAKLPVLQPHTVTSVQKPVLPPLDALTPAQRQAYNNKARKAAPTPAPGAQPTQPATTAPKFVGGGSVPLLVKQYEGLSSTQAGGGTGNVALATDLSYLMEGVDNAIAIFRTATGALAYGPYAPQSFFAPVYHAGDTFTNPQMYYDTMRDRWIVLYLEVAPSGVVTYLDLAVSQSNSPTQPTPGSQYNVYQFATNFVVGISTFCGYETLGVDYYGIYITCANYLSSIKGFMGNTVLAIDKAPLLAGAANPVTYWWNDAVKTANDAGPALALSPALEEGVQDGEFIVATNEGWGDLSNNLTVCALTNQRNIATTQPTLSCLHRPLGMSYKDPIPAHQLGGSTFPVSIGTNQVYYKAGRLFLAWTTGLRGAFLEDQDAIYWAEVRPELASNPRTLSGVEVTQQSIVSSSLFPALEDYYTPSVVGTDEDDIVLVFNRSSTSAYPGIAYTGRKASDAHNAMAGNATVITGTHATTTTWGKYSACAISLNSVTRGTIWYAAEYTGATADPGWNTRLINLRAE